MVLAPRQISGFCQLTLDLWRQHSAWVIVCVCVCVRARKDSMQEFICLFFLPSIIHWHSEAMTSPFIPKKAYVPICYPPLCLFNASVFHFVSRKLDSTTESEAYWEKTKACWKLKNCQSFRRSVLTRAQLFFPLKVKGHLLNIPANIFRRCQMSHSCARCIRLFWDGGRWFPPPPSNIQKRALSTTYRILHKENTHSQTHARIIPPYTPPCVARLCFCLCKITVVQVSSRQSDADRQARKEDSQALVFATKIFLVLQLAVLPSMWLWLQNPSSSSGSRLHLPEEHRGRWKVLSKTSGKVASSFKGPRMYTAHGFLC